MNDAKKGKYSYEEKRFVALLTTCALLAMPFAAYGSNVASVTLKPEQGTYIDANISIGNGGLFGNPYSYSAHSYGTYADAVTAWYSVGIGTGENYLTNAVEPTMLVPNTTSVKGSKNAGTKKVANIAVWYGSAKTYASAVSSQKAIATSSIN